MTRLLIVLSCLIPSTAFVHVGHLGGLAGHDHYVIAAAIAAAAGTSLKGRDEDASFEDEPELQET
tara:strand:- start:29 stop:223 length:195 start_codon:yes stop_codon:yes gene_type:complete